ncbi:cardiolipin synthase (CMP-forming) [Monosporozyma servazzii]
MLLVTRIPLQRYALNGLTFTSYRFNSTLQKPTNSQKISKVGTKINPPSLVKSNLLTIPNIITLTRIGCTPFIGQYIWMNQFTPALILFGYSCITDFLDGYIARRFNMKSVEGTILDPVADKLLMVFTTLAMTLPGGPQIIPWGIATLILGRDALLTLGSATIRFTSMKKVYGQVNWKSYWNISKFPSVEVKPTMISKWNTFLQMLYLGCGGVLLWLGEDDKSQEESENKIIRAIRSQREMLITGFTWLGYIVGTTTVLSGASYIFSKKALTILPILK